MKDSPPRLITSKAGFNASPTLSDQNKTFDSDWYRGGAIKWRLLTTVPANVGYFEVAFPYQLSYVPIIDIASNHYEQGNSLTDYASPFITWDVAPYGPSYSWGMSSFDVEWTAHTDKAVYSYTPVSVAIPYQLIIYEAS